MAMRLKWRLAILPMLVVAAASWGSAQAEEVPLVTGQQWTQSTEPMKKVYLVGLANIAQVETAFQAGNPPADTQSIIPRMVKGLRGQSLDSVREGLDRWYAANPGKLQRPVIETLWFEMIVPGLQKNK